MPPNTNDEQDVDDFVAKRHKVMLEDTVEDSDSEGLGAEPENYQRDVFNIDMSDSDSDSGESAEEEDDDENVDDARQEREGFGPHKKLWYGADTHEYEIMDDEEQEQALKEEEEEALRLQREALSLVRPEDCRDEEDDETEACNGDDGGDVELVDKTKASENPGRVEADSAVAPEVPLLFQEMMECRRQAVIWKERIHWNEVAGILYHLHATFVCNVAFYLCLRTDPDSDGVDLQTHPVLVQIARIRALLKEALALPCKAPASETRGSAASEDDPKSKEAPLDDPESTVPESSVQKENGPETEDEKERKRRKQKRKIRTSEGVAKIMAEDEATLKSLLPHRKSKATKLDSELEQEQKRRKLNKLVGAMNRERKNDDSTRIASADADVARPEVKKTAPVAPAHSGSEDNAPTDHIDDDDIVMRKMLTKKAKKEARKARRDAEAKPHEYTFKDTISPDVKRRASSQVVKNRGLTRYRPRDKKTPRTKNRLAYNKAVVRRKGAVRDYSGKPGSTYSGEGSGINMASRKGSRLSNV